MRWHALGGSVVVVALSELAVVASAGSGTPKASKPAVFDALNGLVVRVTFSGTPTATVGCGDSQVSVPQGSPVQIEQLARSAGGWVVSQSAQLVSGPDGAHVSLAGSSIVGAGATFAVTNPGSGQVGSLGLSNVDKACKSRPLFRAHGSVSVGTTSPASGCGVLSAQRLDALRYSMTIAFFNCRRQTYVALGDSYSSGEGSPPFDPSAGTCDRSSKAWPTIFARKARAIRKQTAASFTELANLACSGATTDALSRPFKEQVSQLDSLYAFDPRFATITIGGTDLGFSGVLFDCFTGNCVQDRLLKTTDRKLEAFAPTLWHTYKKLVGNVSSVIVVGYPNIFPTTQAKTCPWLQPDERRQLNLLAKKLDTVTRNAVSVARRKFGRSRGFRISYASTLNAFAGHELCTRESWVYPLGPSGGNNRGHPTAGGQRAMAKAVVPALRRVL
jgi:lysophospholipase L1-like esterase